MMPILDGQYTAHGKRPTIAILTRGDPATRLTATAATSRLSAVFEALAACDIAAEPVIYDETVAAEVRVQLLRGDGVLVWVDPITDGRDRSALDPLLRDIASAGILVSAHPDIILKLGVKAALFHTRSLGWVADIDLYPDFEDFRARMSQRLAGGGVRVLKQNRGNGGNGVWSVRLVAGPQDKPGADSWVRVEHAWRGSIPEDIRLGSFIERCKPYFAGTGCMIDQPFQPRLPEGMIRCYMVQDRLVGFSYQVSQGLMPVASKAEGIPPGKVMFGPDEPRFQALRAKMEQDWLPALPRVLDIDPGALPVIWDADFLYGPKDSDGSDTYALCEINTSCVFPYPDEAPAEIAASCARYYTTGQR
ncbi:Cj0069 family protein [Acidiphilium sp. PA]|uniref:Cj0069 family protein n=1 Tax=Acidiphilium sp. PA TaxID=2871705 RepID=UPI002244D23E|nr:Cj0069 family protein [Acidiphilium sp. PA]MCW8309214.1 Cj0069 family protein [Acidiphilium sp. PA]